jgi:hypothetical protein
VTARPFGWQRLDVNEYGTPVSIHACWSCGQEFTVCPAREPSAEGWDDCLAPECPSYDQGRDADLLFDSDEGWRVQKGKAE